MVQFTKDSLIKEVLENAPQAAPLFLSIGMHCLGCAMASGETLEEACAVHGVDADAFINHLNALVAAQENVQA
jgi:hybrid cluster-associated redox disulfide protein